MAKPIIEPISLETLGEFALFLDGHMGQHHTIDEWVRGLKTSWTNVDRPNFGFMMRDGGQIVGGIGAIYARRIIRGQIERFCNITSWCVLDAYRKYSMQLAMAMLAQPGYHFTDFSPTKVVGGVLQFLKFKPLDDAVVVIANLPLPPWHGRLVTDSGVAERALTGAAGEIWRDHAGFPWLKQVLVGDTGRWCHVIYKRDTFKGLPSARIVYLSDASAFERCLGRLAVHFLRLGMVSTHVERRFLARVPRLSKVRSGFNQKVYLSATLNDGDIDYLYSESVALDL